MGKIQVVCIPGSIAPAAQRYAPLKAAVGDSVDLHWKDLEVYRDATPPADYSVELELQGIDRVAGALGLDRFHLVGYSGGGFLSIAYAGTRPDRLLSLGLFEAAAIPGTKTPYEQEALDALNARLRGLESGDFMKVFVSTQVKEGVQLPAPPVSSLEAMKQRATGIAAMMRSFESYSFERSSLREATFPAYVGYGDLTHEMEEVKAGILARLFADVRVQRFRGVHHFVPPDQIYTAAHAAALQDLWQRGELKARQAVAR
ncbi:MAG TPA: alpha/beta hydrolase [Candidatus Dormibacteraeota bacterium]|nr:alpha/beta hydrolase [Candidatus Dormibacteraeota bacterium]